MATYPTTEVSYGQTSADVKTLQNFLISQGYSIPDGATGYFGNETKSALSQWQSANGISSSTAGYGTNWGPLSQAAAQKSTTTSSQATSSYPAATTTQPYSTGGIPAAPVAAPGGYTYNNQSYAAGTGPYATQFPAPKQTTTATNQNNQTGQGGTGTGTGSTGTGTGTGGTGTGSTGTGGTGTSGTGTGTGTGTGSGTSGGTSFSAVTGYQTGNAQLDAIVAGLQTTLNQMIASGQVINPNIALSPSDITTFLNQAKGIIDPYFASQISQIQEGLSQNLTSLQQQWDNEQQADQLAFQQDLAKTREANAGQGTALSGGRNLQELQATQSAQNQINQQQNSLQSQAQSAVNTAAQQIGSSSTNTLPFNTYTASNQGLGSVNQSGQLAYSPINVTQGSLEAAQQTAESTQATSLAAQALQNRALNFYPAQK